MTTKPHHLDQVFHRGYPSLPPNSTPPVVIKHGDVAVLCSHDGDLLRESDQGIYFHDMRYLSCQQLKLNGLSSLTSLLADVSGGHRGLFELTNPDICDQSGEVAIRKETLGIRREKIVDSEITENITIRNYTTEPVEVSLNLSYEADFADVFVIRGADAAKRGKLRSPNWLDHTLEMRYDGADGHERCTAIEFSRKPDRHHRNQATFYISLSAHESWQLTTVVKLLDRSDSDLEDSPNTGEGPGHHEIRRAHQGEVSGGIGVETDNELFNEALRRSFLDLHMLSMRERGRGFFAAGVPWYMALFGRDSLVTALQMAAYEPEMAAGTLRVLASWQGRQLDDWRDEQPGKILHEYRVGELANLDEIPQTPYYGSVDSTPMFLVVMGLYSAWTGKLDLFHELHDSVLAALEWIDRYGDSDGDGFIDYETRSSKGLRNQGWKDSGNGVVMEDGKLAELPIALPEVQGVVCLAWTMMADLFERDGDEERAHELRKRARKLHSSFNRDFWLADERYFAFCKQGDGRFSGSIASNAAHALWTGIVDVRHAGRVVRRVTQKDMLTGWGVRTLSSQDISYNPLDYQVGSIWPHDNAFIMAGMHRYGFIQEAGEVFTAMMKAATKFDQYRLPELFAGFDTDFSDVPVRYPVACSPQAWASGSLPYMLQTALGLRPNAFERQLLIVQPHLPDWMNWVRIRGLRVGGATVDLRYQRADKHTLVSVVRKSGKVDILMPAHRVNNLL